MAADPRSSSTDDGTARQASFAQVEIETREDEQRRVGKWMELMGKDLMMKVTSVEDDGETDNGASDERGPRSAELGDAILIDFTGRAADGGVNGGGDKDDDDGDDDHPSRPRWPPFLEAKGWLITLGDMDVPPGVEMAVRFLRRGERAVVKCHSKYGYGLSGRRRGATAGGYGDGCRGLPPCANVVFDVHIRGIVSSASELFRSDEFRMLRARAKKTIGNDVYQHEWIGDAAGDVAKQKALKLYGSGGELMISLVHDIGSREGNGNNKDGANADVEERALGILVDCLNNVAAVHMRAKSYGLAMEAAANVLKYDITNIKALCRAAKAAMLDPGSTFEESDMAIRAAEDAACDAEDKADVKRLRLELERRKRDYKKREKAMYAGKMAKKGGVSQDPVGGTERAEIKTKAKAALKDNGQSADEKVYGEEWKGKVSLPHVILAVCLMLAFLGIWAFRIATADPKIFPPPSSDWVDDQPEF